MSEQTVWLVHGLLWLTAAGCVAFAIGTEQDQRWSPTMRVWWARLQILTALWLIYTAGILLGTGLSQ